MFDYIAKIRRGTANVDIIIIIIGSTEVLFDSSICIIGYNTISNRDRIRYNMCSSSSGRNKAPKRLRGHGRRLIGASTGAAGTEPQKVMMMVVMMVEIRMWCLV